jgi:hypothetical protein
MADVSDIERNVDSARNFAAEDRDAMAIRMFDGIAYLLIEIVRELREIKEELDTQGAAMREAVASTQEAPTS